MARDGLHRRDLLLRVGGGPIIDYVSMVFLSSKEKSLERRDRGGERRIEMGRDGGCRWALGAEGICRREKEAVTEVTQRT
jgi:hypothetical protein